MKERFKLINMKIETRARVDVVNRIIADYKAQGFTLTLRQLYYQHVARGIIPNTEREYKKLGSIVNDGRMAGLIDWDAIEDRTRSLRGLTHWESPSQIIRATAHSFQLDRWANQPNRLEVWIEKDALIGVIEGLCQRNDVNYFSCRGYVSQSEMYVAAQRISGYLTEGQQVHVLHLGDHDPSGIDMSRDVTDRISTFLYGEDFTLSRLALNWDQVQQYQPPPNPAKSTDSRYRDYRSKFGVESWELDALEPSVINDLIEARIDDLRDPDLWAETEAKEQEHVALLKKVSDRWGSVAAFLA